MALIQVSANEIDDFQTVMRAVASGTPPACRNTALVGNAYTQWMIESGMAEADPNHAADFDEDFFPPALDVLYSQAVTIFRSGICDNLSPLAQRQLEEACRWARGSSALSFGVVGIAVGVIGLGVAAWSLFGRRR